MKIVLYLLEFYIDKGNRPIELFVNWQSNYSPIKCGIRKPSPSTGRLVQIILKMSSGISRFIMVNFDPAVLSLWPVATFLQHAVVILRENIV